MDKTKKQIVFVEPFPEVMIYKIANILKLKGYETISIRILESKDSSREFYDKAYDKISSFDLSFFKMDLKNIPNILFSLLNKLKRIVKTFVFISKLDPYVVIVRAKPNWPCALIRILFKKISLIYFPYDIRSEDSISLIKKSNIKKFEINSEKFCFEKADGIIHKGAPDELNFLEGRLFEKINFTQPQLMFLPYCSEEFIVPINKNKLSKKDGEIHVVHVSSVGSVDLKECSWLFDYFNEFTKNNIHIHLYTKPNTLSKEEIIKSFNELYKNEINSKYFHLHDPKNPKELIKEISQFDFGIILMHPLNKAEDSLESNFGTGNKISSYLEAGLPFFYSPEIKFVDQIMNSYKLRLHLRDEKDIKKMKEQINRLNYNELEENVKKARKDFLMEKHFPKLEKFIEEVVNKNKKG